MKNSLKKHLIPMLLILGMLAFSAAAPAENAPTVDGALRIENGTLLPIETANTMPTLAGHLLSFCA